MFDIFCPGNRQIRDESDAAERVVGGSECGGTSVPDVQISVRHCSDVTIVNTHSDGPVEPGETIDRDHYAEIRWFLARRLEIAVFTFFSMLVRNGIFRCCRNARARARAVLSRGKNRGSGRAETRSSRLDRANARRLQNVSEVGSLVDR